jgi:PAS domain S-box-containing protein
MEDVEKTKEELIRELEETRRLLELARAKRPVGEEDGLFEAIVDSTTDCVLVWNRNHDCVFANNAAIDHLKTTREELVTKGIRDGLSHVPGLLTSWSHRVEQVFETGHSMRVKEEIHSDHGAIHVESNLTPIKDSSGSIQMVSLVYRDVTAERISDRRAAEARELNDKIIHAAPLGILAYRSDGRCVSANEAAALILGKPRDELLRQHFTALESWKRAKLLNMAREVLFSGVERRIEAHLVTASGKDVWAHWRMARFTSGGEPHLLVMLNDITARRHVEDALKASEERMRLLIERSPVGIAIVQHDRYVYVNPAFTKIRGFSGSHEIIDAPLAELVVPEDRDLLIQKQGADGSKLAQACYEVRGIAKDGNQFDMAVWPLQIDHFGEPAMLLFVADTSEAKNLKAQLLQAQKMQAIGTLTGGVAHDFNNLLTVILALADSVLAEGSRQGVDLGAVREIARACERGAELVRGMLAFSRKVEPRLRPVNLNHQVEHVANLLARTIPKMIEIEMRLSDDIDAVNADAGQVEQVLMNLAVNAKDAMTEGGKLIIETKNVFLDNEFCRSHLAARVGNYVMLAVSDTGIGMDKETLAHIFEPFFTTKPPGQGSGLGLSMVYGIVKQHDGYISCDSQPGEGTVFRIYLPSTAGALTLDGSTEEAQAVGGSETILLVDDEKLIRSLGMEFLTLAGYKVICAGTGKEALEIYSRQKDQISLIILDLIMPEMCGRQCLHELIKMNPNVKVLVASGYSHDSPDKEGSGMGVVGFIHKPYRMAEMLKKIRCALDHETPEKRMRANGICSRGYREPDR